MCCRLALRLHREADHRQRKEKDHTSPPVSGQPARRLPASGRGCRGARYQGSCPRAAPPGRAPHSRARVWAPPVCRMTLTKANRLAGLPLQERAPPRPGARARPRGTVATHSSRREVSAGRQIFRAPGAGLSARGSSSSSGACRARKASDPGVRPTFPGHCSPPGACGLRTRRGGSRWGGRCTLRSRPRERWCKAPSLCRARYTRAFRNTGGGVRRLWAEEIHFLRGKCISSAQRRRAGLMARSSGL